MSEPPHPSDAPEPSRDRRRWLLPAAGLAAALAVPLITIIVTGSDAERAPARPAVAPISLPGTAGAVTPSATPDAARTATPTAIASRAATPVATAVRTSTPPRRPAATRSTTAPAPRPATTTTTPRPSCTPSGVADVVQVFTDGVVKVAARTDGVSSNQLCSDFTLPEFVALGSYGALVDRVARKEQR